MIGKLRSAYEDLVLKIANPPYMELVIEAIDESGPIGLPALSVVHYGLQNGDLMRDPEMCFELGLAGGTNLNPFYWRNDYVSVEQWSRNIVRDLYVHLAALHEQHVRFAKTWGNNLRRQGFAEAFTDKCILGKSSSSGADARPTCAAPRPFTLNRSKGASHHGKSSQQRNRIPQCLAVPVERIQD
jgi:hypothetical protein